MSSLIVFTGENTFDLHHKLQQWKQQFIQKHGTDNLIEYSAKQVQFSQLAEEVSVLPFLSEKRMLILDGIPAIEVEQLALLEQSIHPDVLLLIVSPSIDKRLKINKELLKRADVHEFTSLDLKKLPEWLMSKALDEGVQLTPELAKFMVELIGSNQFALHTELQKLALVEGELTKDVIKQLCLPHSEALIWELMDYIAQGKSAQVMQLLRAIGDAGESPLGIWATFIWIVSQLQLFALAKSSNNPSFGELTKEWGVKFGPAKTFSRIASAYSKTGSTLCTTVTNTDIALKTGKLQYTDQNQIEVQSVLDLYTVQLCRLATMN